MKDRIKKLKEKSCKNACNNACKLVRTRSTHIGVLGILSLIFSGIRG